MTGTGWLRGVTMAGLAAMTLTGCVAATEIRKYEDKTPVSPVGESRPIMLRRLVSKIPVGQPVGTVQVGIFCEGRNRIIWQRGENAQIGTEELFLTLTAELAKAGYRAIGRRDSLFDDPQEWEAELLLAGAVKHVALNVCHFHSSSSGEASVEIEWQVFERRSRSVVFTATTGGTGKTASSPGGGDRAYRDAFAASLRNFLAQDGFAALMSSVSPVAKPEKYPVLAVDVLSLAESGTVAAGDLVQYAHGTVVTIPIGTGHGSGVIVSPVGLVLTSAHVVGAGTGKIQVELATGQRVSGEVLRVNRVADVALVQLDKGDYRAVPIGSIDSLKIGAPVFAIGTPLHAKLSRTVTRGVVSAFRVEDGRRLIQSDVTVHAGSSGGPLLDEQGRLVGVTQGGVGHGGIGIGLNHFVPIDEAWVALQLTTQVKSVDPVTLFTGAGGTTPAGPKDGDVAEKLRLIDDLRQKGLISPAEAEQRRREVLDRALR